MAAGRMKPYIIIKERYDPPEWNARKIGEALTTMTYLFGLRPLKDPNHRHQVRAAWCDKNKVAYVRRRTVRDPRAKGWHQDGDLDNGLLDSSIVLWTSNTPTEIRTFDGDIIVPPNRSVILIRNNACYHRRPPDCPRVRWLFRQRVRNI
jgi:hypothetical protein